jgi:hypothetical protein
MGAFSHAGPDNFTRHIQHGFTRAAPILPINAEGILWRLTREETEQIKMMLFHLLCPIPGCQQFNR